MNKNVPCKLHEGGGGKKRERETRPRAKHTLDGTKLVTTVPYLIGEVCMSNSQRSEYAGWTMGYLPENHTHQSPIEYRQDVVKAVGV